MCWNISTNIGLGWKFPHKFALDENFHKSSLCWRIFTKVCFVGKLPQQSALLKQFHEYLVEWKISTEIWLLRKLEQFFWVYIGDRLKVYTNSMCKEKITKFYKSTKEYNKIISLQIWSFYENLFMMMQLKSFLQTINHFEHHPLFQTWQNVVIYTLLRKYIGQKSCYSEISRLLGLWREGGRGGCQLMWNIKKNC